MKYMRDFIGEFTERKTFTLRDVRIYLSDKKISKDYLRVFIHNLLKKGKIKRITKGVYTFMDEVEVVGFAFSPFYYGLQEALSLRNLWEQETNPIVITPRKVRSGLRVFQGRNFLVKKINRKMFFGFEMIKYYDFWIPVSDIEKTLIDFVYFRQPLSKEVVTEMKKKIRPKIMKQYLVRCPKYLSKRVKNLLK